jgi:adenylate cyclase
LSASHVQRKLAAILAVDIVGYSRLMSEDESGTLDAVKSLRKELFGPIVSEHRGRIVKLMGDGALVEFPSAVDAVTCAVAVQNAVADRNAGTPQKGIFELRIGVNIGDVIVEGADIYGGGVNVAARLEALAEPGSVYISEDTYRQIRNRIKLKFRDLGEQKLKNISDPVRVYEVLTSSEKEEFIGQEPNLSLPDKPSIAVLPFANLGDNRDQDYFADGVTEDVITALSHIRWLFVIARNSSFIYKGRAINVTQVARELGVRYVLEGSVRKIGDRMRVTAQLVDALSGAHHWAERYDRNVTDVFSLQDEIARNVAAAIEPRLLAAEGIRLQNRPPGDLDAWDMVARAMSRFWHVTGPDVDAAISLLKVAVKRHPDYAPAHSMLAFSLVLAGHFGWLHLIEVPELALESARRAVELDDSDPWAYLALGYVAFVARRTDDAAAHFARATELNPNFAAAYGYWGYALAFDGRSDEAIERMSLAMRMSPHDRQNSIYMGGMAVAHYLASQHDQAIDWARKAVRQGPSMTAPHRILCASLAQAGRLDEAQDILARIREMQPYFSIEWAERMIPYTSTQMPQFLDGLRKAGVT